MYRENAFSKTSRPVSRARLGFLLLILLLTTVVACDDRKEIIDVIIAGEVFKVEVVRSSEDKALGLMHRKKLGPREGMLFVYSRDRRLSFWMKDTIIPLSIAFLSSGAEITHMPIRFEDVWRALQKKEPVDNWITKSPLGSCKSAPEIRIRHRSGE